METMDYIINGVSLSAVVLGLVELLKGIGISGNKLTISAFILGLVLGTLYQVSIEVPAGFSGWFGTVLFGLWIGLTATKGYDAIRSAANTTKNES